MQCHCGVRGSRGGEKDKDEYQGDTEMEEKKKRVTWRGRAFQQVMAANIKHQ